MFSALLALAACGGETKFADQSGQNQAQPADVDDIGGGEAKVAKKPEVDVGTKGAGDDDESKKNTLEVEESGEKAEGDPGTADGSEDTPEAVTTEVEYTADTLRNEEASLDLSASLAERALTMVRGTKKADGSKDFTQVNRPQYMDSHTQGHAGAPAEENFMQEERGLLDILVVVDNSGSMRQEQTNLATKLSALLSEVEGASWQVSIVTTDPNNPCNRKLIKKGDADAAQEFKDTVNGVGLNGSGNEQGIRTAVQGLKCSNNWVRNGSSIAVLIVSDEDNCSNGTDCGNNPWASPSYLTDTFTELGRTVKEDARVYGLIWVPGTDKDNAYNVGNVYQELIDLTGGVSGKIQDSDYTNTLKQISADVKSILKNEWELAHTPDAGSLKVYVKEKDGTDYVERTSGFSVSGTTLSFEMPYPSDGSTIKTTYTYGAAPTYSEFSFAQAAANGTVSVSVNGADAAANTYTIDYAGKKIVFNDKPADDADIRISYRGDVALNNSWMIIKDAVDGSVKAKINGTDAAITSYNKDTGEVILAEVPADAAAVAIDYQQIVPGDPVLSYLFEASGGVANLRVVDADSGDELTATYTGGTLTFTAEQFVEGRKLMISYRDPSLDNREVDLGHMPIDGSVKVMLSDADGEPIECVGGTYTLDGTKFTFTCDAGLATAAKVTFDYESKELQSYSVEGLENPEVAKWSVWLNDIPTIDFSREGAKITITKPLPHGTKVRIRATSLTE